MVTQKAFIFVKQDVSNTQDITQSLTAHAEIQERQMRAVWRQASSQLQRMYVLLGYTNEFSRRTLRKKIVTSESQPLNLQAYKLDYSNQENLMI